MAEETKKEEVEEVEVEKKSETKNKEEKVEQTTTYSRTQVDDQDSRKPYRENKKDYRRDSRDYKGSGDRDDYKFRRMRRKVCLLCKEKNYVLDYKDAETIKRFINEKGKILPRRATGTCAKHQREIAQVIKRARHIAVIPYTID